MSVQPIEALQPEGLAATYADLRVVAAGGAGIVFRGKHRILGRDTAIKLILPSFMIHEMHRLRTLQEARVMAQVDHPHVVRIHDAGEIRLTESDAALLAAGLKELRQSAVFPTDASTIFLAMEWVAGGTLLDRLMGDLVHTQAEAGRIALELLDALGAVHGKGVTHRDVKPANVLLTLKGKVKLADFGLGNSAQKAGLTRQGVMMGTPGFMSPQQMLDASSVDGRADLYATGVLFHCLLRSRLPVDHNKGPRSPSFSDVLDGMASSPGDRKYENFWRDMAPTVEAFIRRATQRNPDLGFQTAAEMADALGKVMDDLLVRVPSPVTLVATPESYLPAQLSDDEEVEDGAGDEALLASYDPRVVHAPGRFHRRWLLAVCVPLLVIGVAVWGFSSHSEPVESPAIDLSDQIVKPVRTVEITPVPVEEPDGDLAASVEPELIVAPVVELEPELEPEPPKKVEVKASVETPSSSVVTVPEEETDPWGVNTPDPEEVVGVEITASGAKTVWLAQGATFYELPETLPTGYYDLYVQFSGGERRKALDSAVYIGDAPMKVVCDAAMGICGWRP